MFENAKVITLCLGKKIGNSSRSIKSYRATLKIFWNGKRLCNTPLMLVNNKQITEFETKVYLIDTSSPNALQSTVQQTSLYPALLD